MSEVKEGIKNVIIVFLPSDVGNYSYSYLYGDFLSLEGSSKTFYTVQVSQSLISDQCFGVYEQGKHKNGFKDAVIHHNWIHIEVDDDITSIMKLKVMGKFVEIDSYQIKLIYYDFDAILKSELLNKINRNLDADYFTRLVQKVQSCKRTRKRKDYIAVQICTWILQHLILSFSFFSHKIFPVSKYLHLGEHFHNHMNGFVWVVEKAKKEHKLTIMVLNFLLSTLLDIILGNIFLNWVTAKVSSTSFPGIFLMTVENVVSSLKNLIHWLTGNPGGLKLNHAFNQILATFFSFHVDIWGTFIDFLRPVMGMIFLAFLFFGRLGITYQISIIADLMAVISFHVYCVYVYAARLYNVQLSGLISLWRLFLGRKKNPLRGKVDSCRYNVQQLFIGTIGFTILLFLLPTTVMYYVVFSLMKIFILAFCGILKRIQYFISSLPVYSTFIWLFHSSKVTAGIQLKLDKASSRNGLLIIFLCPKPQSWWETVIESQPECLVKPPSFQFREFLQCCLWGKIIHPS